MQALLNMAATASLALALVGGVAVEQGALDVGVGSETHVRAESQAGLPQQSSVSLDEAISAGTTIGGSAIQAGDPEVAAGIGSADYIGASGAAALGSRGVQDVSATADTDDSGRAAIEAPAGTTSASLIVDGSATLNLNAQNQEIDDAVISGGGSKVGGAVTLALRAR